MRLDLNAGWDWPGKHALVDRASLAFRAARRWEVLVFRCPEQADTYCIKRVVGLPGEEIQIRAGDVYVNGNIARKNLSECREVAQLVHDASFAPADEGPISKTPGWHPAEESSNWHAPTEGEFVHSEEQHPPAASPSSTPKFDWLEFHAARDRPLTDDDSYNQSESRRLNQVSDVMLACELRCIGPGELVIRSDIDRDRFDVRINPLQRSAVLSRNSEELKQVELADDALTASTSLILVRFDRQILLAIGDQLVLHHEYEVLPESLEQADVPNEQTPPPWAIGATALRVEVGHLRLLRDIYYTVPTGGRHAWGVRHPVTLSDGEFFVLGDNSPISADSRIQDQPGIERKSLIGRLLTTW